MAKRPLPTLLLGLLALLSCGCGTLRGVGEDVLELRTLEDLPLMVIDSSGQMTASPFLGEDGRTNVPLATARVLLFVLETGGVRDSVVLNSIVDLESQKENLSFSFFLPIPMFVDALTGSQLAFEKNHVLFRGDHERADSGRVIIYDVTDNRTLERSYRIGDYKILLELHLGIRTPLSGAVIFGNEVGLSAGYRILPPLTLLLNGSIGGSVGYGSE